MSKTAAPAKSVLKKRGQGRPVSGGNDVGRERLLIATAKLLRIMPPLRVSISRMAHEANADPAAIRNYFGNCAPFPHRLTNDELEEAGTEESRARLRSMTSIWWNFSAVCSKPMAAERPSGFRSSLPAWCWMDCANAIEAQAAQHGREKPVKE